MHYASLVGMQPMAVINPILCFEKKFFKKIHLLYNEKVHENTIKIKEFIERQTICNSDDIVMWDLENITYSGELSCIEHKIIHSIQEEAEQLYFNIAAGMKFQMIKLLLETDIYKTKYLYPEEYCIHMFFMGNNGKKHIDLYPHNLKVYEILDLQGIDYKHFKPKRDRAIEDIKRFNLLTDSYQTGLNIGGINFDIVLNHNNCLYLVNDFDDADNEQALNKARKLMDLALNKNVLKGLYHKHILTITNNVAVQERLNREARSKVECLLINSKNYNQKLTSLLKPRRIKSPKGSWEKLLADVTFSGNGVLLTFLSPDPHPTIKALWSHKPEKAIIFYTPENNQVNMTKVNLTSQLKRLPVREVVFVPTDVLGFEAYGFPRLNSKNVSVNITPGTNSQAFFLSAWAMKSSASIFSIHKNEISQIPKGISFPIQSPSMAELVAILSGADVESAMTAEHLRKKKQFYENILTFFREIIEDGHNFSDFPTRMIETESFIFSPDKTMVKLKNKNSGVSQTWKIEGGLWLEELAGYTLLKAGATDVLVRVHVPWSDETTSFLEKKYRRRTHLTDLDVIALYRGNILCLSCKESNKLTRKNAEEIKAVASGIGGRFAIPLLFQLKYLKDGYFESQTGVLKFGVRNLVNIESLNNLIEQARKKPQTTSD